MDALNGVDNVNAAQDSQKDTTRQPATRGRSNEGGAHDTRIDSTAFTTRAQREAAKTKEPERDIRRREPDAASEAPRRTSAGSGSATASISDGTAARDAARQTADQIVSQPALAAAAQANTNGDAVLNMLR